MATQRPTPAPAGSNKALWGAVAVIVVIVLAMGATLIRIQAKPQEPRMVVLPAAGPSANAPAAADNSATNPVPSAAPSPTASTATDQPAETNRPRVVHSRTSEPAVARTPAPVVSR
ncbi:hypothetical protein [Rhodoferax sp.]|uniref:hypothetical protein n=1 Tax=Rhodoferax sp. TaxID=50421 RepID=UPI0025CC4FF8|nr:hypothetical protein [Rhodoferax sp.]